LLVPECVQIVKRKFQSCCITLMFSPFNWIIEILPSIPPSFRGDMIVPTVWASWLPTGSNCRLWIVRIIGRTIDAHFVHHSEFRGRLPPSVPHWVSSVCIVFGAECVRLAACEITLPIAPYTIQYHKQCPVQSISTAAPNANAQFLTGGRIHTISGIN